MNYDHDHDDGLSLHLPYPWYKIQIDLLGTRSVWDKTHKGRRPAIIYDGGGGERSQMSFHRKYFRGPHGTRRKKILGPLHIAW